MMTVCWMMYIAIIYGMLRHLNMELTLIQIPVEELEAPRQSGSHAVRVNTDSAQKKTETISKSDTVLKVVLRGIALDGGEVAALISRLEESEYFVRVVPIFSRSQSRFDTTITEFEIRCVVADFITVE